MGADKADIANGMVFVKEGIGKPESSTMSWNRFFSIPLPASKHFPQQGQNAAETFSATFRPGSTVLAGRATCHQTADPRWRSIVASHSHISTSCFLARFSTQETESRCLDVRRRCLGTGLPSIHLAVRFIRRKSAKSPVFLGGTGTFALPFGQGETPTWHGCCPAVDLHLDAPGSSGGTP